MRLPGPAAGPDRRPTIAHGREIFSYPDLLIPTLTSRLTLLTQIVIFWEKIIFQPFSSNFAPILMKISRNFAELFRKC